MDVHQSEVFKAHDHVYTHILNYVNSMVLGCALELGIPDVIHNHKKPITHEELVLKLNLSVEKTLPLQQVMRLLTRANFFSLAKFHDQEGQEEKEGYVLTLSSKLLLKRSNTSEELQNLPCLLPLANYLIDPLVVTTWHFLGRWFSRNESTVFETANGNYLWEFAKINPRFNKIFNDAMASGSEMMKLVVKDKKGIFDGVDTLVDVGGGTGLVANILAEAFPHMSYIVFDLPHVIADMVDTRNLKYVGGDMFSSIPSADAVLLKNVLHDWDDEDVLKILKTCKETISFAPQDGKKGKVIIIEMVIGENHGHEVEELHPIMAFNIPFVHTGKERTSGEWEKLFHRADFNRYTITHISSWMSIIELFP